MINHIRTLLLNKSGHSQYPREPGSQYVSPHYSAKKMPPQLRTLHTTLFGTAPDRMFANYRLHQIMSLLHASDLAEYVTELDSRITYLPLQSSFFDDIMKITARGEFPQFAITGHIAADEQRGICHYQWHLSIGEDGDVFIQRTRPPIADVERSHVVITGGLCQPVQLPGCNLYVQFGSPAMNATHNVDVYARPETDFSEILSRFANAFSSIADDLLPVTTRWQTFRNVWNEHPISAQRYAAALLTFAFVLNDITVTETA